MTTTIEVLTRTDLLQFKKELIEEISRLFSERSKAMETDYLKSKQVKRILKCSDSTLQYYRDSGKLPYKKVGSTYYYTTEDIEKLMKSANAA